jgi:phosphatidylglycerophosphate synthase
VTSAGPLVVLLGDGPLPDDLERAVASRATAEAGELGPTLDAGRAVPALRQLASAAEARSVAVVDARALTVPTVYGDVVADPRDDNAVLRTGDGRVVALRIRAAERDVLGAPELAGCRTTSSLLSAAATLLAVRGPVRELGPGDFPLTVVEDDDPAPALAAVDAVDEAALRLRRASRSDDGFLSTFLVRPLSRRLTRRAVGRGFSPATVTAVSLTLGLASAASYGGGGRGWLLLGSLLLLTSLVVDCVDGEVARYTRTFSPLGGWLDVASDRIKEYAVYAGLVTGVARVTGERLWGLALASLALLVVRHFVDFGFAASGVGSGPRAGGVAALSASTSRVPAVMWAKRAVIMPVGERTLLLVVLVPLVGVRWTLWLLLASGVVAAAYTTAGRVGRALAPRSSTSPRLEATERLVGQCDAAPLPAGLLPVAGRFGWLTPSACRLVEQALVVGVAAAVAGQELLPGVYAVLFVAAFRGYDVTYRQRLAGATVTRDPLRSAGWPVRVLVVAVVALLVAAGVLGAGPAAAVLALLAALWFAAALRCSARWWADRPPGAARA